MTFPKLTPSTASTRGHTEQVLGRRIVCLTCYERKPKRGGWTKPCEKPRDSTRGLWG